MKKATYLALVLLAGSITFGTSTAQDQVKVVGSELVQPRPASESAKKEYGETRCEYFFSTSYAAATGASGENMPPLVIVKFTYSKAATDVVVSAESLIVIIDKNDAIPAALDISDRGGTAKFELRMDAATANQNAACLQGTQRR